MLVFIHYCYVIIRVGLLRWAVHGANSPVAAFLLWYFYMQIDIVHKNGMKDYDGKSATTIIVNIISDMQEWKAQQL